ncbi:hypothetical protein [Bacillus sp. FJAT-29814]|uniref:hypothetical protein n=1 Tax=Bacillus sp. FJAT-29814 TaxID=1729688 RepID=UPI000835B181|nr:hypothetical protein [Bacillus sp. FJAT-29814]
MKDKLIEVLNTIADLKNMNPNIMVEVKKAIVHFCQRENYTQTETLNFLNQALTLINEKQVTMGCVKHHWLND